MLTKLNLFSDQNKKYNQKNDEDEHQENLHSPMRFHFPEKIHMKNKTVEDTKYIIPPLDLSQTKKGAKASNNSHNNQSNISEKSNLKPEELLRLRKKNFEIEEWQETVKLVSLSEEEIDRYFNNKMLHKLIDALENLVKIIANRNENVNSLKKENMSLSSQISQLKTEQLNLTKSYFLLKEKYRELEDNMHDFDKRNEFFDTSMVINKSKLNLLLYLKTRLIIRVECTIMENTQQTK